MVNLYVSDTELTIETAGRSNFHAKTYELWRLTDGMQHPVRIIRPAQQPQKVVKQSGDTKARTQR